MSAAGPPRGLHTRAAFEAEVLARLDTLAEEHPTRLRDQREREEMTASPHSYTTSMAVIETWQGLCGGLGLLSR